jgi:hypothetical protein
MAALPSGSYLAFSHATNVVHGAASDEVVAQWNEVGGEPVVLRHPDELAGFCTGLEIIEPGVVSVSQWGPRRLTGRRPRSTSSAWSPANSNHDARWWRRQSGPPNSARGRRRSTGGA